jgi:hypothetical protein
MMTQDASSGKAAAVRHLVAYYGATIRILGALAALFMLATAIVVGVTVLASSMAFAGLNKWTQVATEGSAGHVRWRRGRSVRCCCPERCPC